MQVFEGQEKNVARVVSKIKDEAALWARREQSTLLFC
jgi:hypothetical protein